MRYINVKDGQAVGLPFPKPLTITLEVGAVVGCGWWIPEDFTHFGMVPVEGEADPASEIEVGYTFDADAGVARPIIEILPAPVPAPPPTYADLRAVAYRDETDPMIGQVLRGEISADDYKAACAAIKARYPKPEQLPPVAGSAD